MTKKIKLESEKEKETNLDYQNVQIENCNTTLTTIQKRLETMQKRLNKLYLQYEVINNNQLKRYKGKIKK